MYNRKMRSTLSCVILVLNSYSVLFSQEIDAVFTPKDIFMLHGLKNPEISPDGKWIAYSVNARKCWHCDGNSDIWLISSDGTNKIQMTTHEKNESSPKWSADGKAIAFLSDRSGLLQLYYINMIGGEPIKVTEEKNGVKAYQWYSNSLAYITDDDRPLKITTQEEEADGGFDISEQFTTSSLFVKKHQESEPKKIVGNQYYIHEFSSSPDGNYFLMVTAKNSDLYLKYNESKINLITNKGESIFEFIDGVKELGNPLFSPDGKRISFTASTVGFSANNGLFVMDVNGKLPKNLTNIFDPTITGVAWSGNQTLLFSTPRNAWHGMYSVDMNGAVKPFVNPYWVYSSWSYNSTTGNIAFVASKSNTPSELYMLKKGLPPDKAQMLTNDNVNYIKNKKTASSKVVKFKSFDGVEVEAVLHFPFGFKEGNKYPLMVLPHGGPDGIIMDGFSSFGQFFGGAGFIVYEPNFRGSIGYGSDFYKANRGKLGDIDYKDIMTGLNYLITQGFVDTNKMVVGGWSYGGYMTNWIIGHSNRFKAAVCVAGVSNTVSNYGQGDINHSEVAKWEFEGIPVLNMENYHRASPINFLENCKTPTLFLHGERDDRVHVAQPWEAYRALDNIGVETKLVLYPDAEHSIRAPKQFNDVITRWIDWYKVHLVSN